MTLPSWYCAGYADQRQRRVNADRDGALGSTLVRTRGLRDMLFTLINFARTLAEGNGSLVKQMFLSSPADLFVPCESSVLS